MSKLIFTSVIAKVTFVCFLLLYGCGGSDDPAEPVVIIPPPPPATNAWNEVEAAIEAFGIDDLRLVVGDEDGIVYTYEKGDFPMSRTSRMASASKLLTSTTIMKLVENGQMSLTDRPQDYISWWTSDAADQRSEITLSHLLSFTSGFSLSATDGSCVADPLTTSELCVQEIYNGGVSATPGAELYYGPAHLQIAAYMAALATDTGYDDLFRLVLADQLGLSDATAFSMPSRENPRAAGGAEATASDYAEFLRALMAGELISNMDAFFADRTPEPVALTYRPDAVLNIGQDWHYGFGFWRQCDAAVWEASCDGNVVISSSGAFGWTPWIDLSNGYFAIIAIDENFSVGLQPAVESVVLQQELMPFILGALQATTL